MTKHVLLLGVGGVVFFTVGLVVFGDYNDSRFTRPLFELWFLCLLIAIVSDAVIRPAAKRAVSAFAESLSNEVGLMSTYAKMQVNQTRKDSAGKA